MTSHLAFLTSVIRLDDAMQLEADPTDSSILTDYYGGRTLGQIAADLGIPQRALLDKVRRMGLVTRRRIAALVMELCAPVIVDEYLGGMSSIELGRRYGISDNAVRRVLHAARVKMRGPGASTATTCKICGRPKVKGRRLCRFHTRLQSAECTRHWNRRKKAIPQERWRIAA